MSHTYPTTASSSSSSSPSSNFQLIINDALNTYKKHTKKDLCTHPLAAQLQTCESPASILAVLQQQVQRLDQSRSTDERWTKWLDPTVNVLYAFSNILGAGVSLVCPKTCASMKYILISMWQVFSPASIIFAGVGVLLSVRILNTLAWDNVTHISIRRPRILERAKNLSSTSLATSKCFSDASRSTQKCDRPRK